MSFIHSIYFKKDNGFIESTKFIKDIDLNTLSYGQTIESFYKESGKLYNIFCENEDQSFNAFIDKKMTIISQEEIVNKIKENFILLLSEISSAPLPDLLNDFIDENGKLKYQSNFKEFIQKFEYKTGISPEFTPVEVFSLKNYQKISNELYFLSDISNNIPLGHFMKSLVKSFNSFLAYENIVKDFEDGYFSFDKDEFDKSFVSYSSCLQPLRYSESIMHQIYDVFKKQNKMKP